MAKKDAWIYKVTVPAEKSDAFIAALVDLDLIDDENLKILQQGRELKVATMINPMVAD